VSSRRSYSPKRETARKRVAAALGFGRRHVDVYRVAGQARGVACIWVGVSLAFVPTERVGAALAAVADLYGTCGGIAGPTDLIWNAPVTAPAPADAGPPPAP